MKKTVIVLLAAVISFSFAQTSFANEMDANSQIQTYISEKIVPVVVGVLTAVIALITALGSIAKNLNALKDTKEVFCNESREREKAFDKNAKLLCENAQRLEDTVKDLPQIKEKVDILNEECKTLAQILSLGFSANKEVVKSGKGREMAYLIENLERTVNPVNNEEAENE